MSVLTYWTNRESPQNGQKGEDNQLIINQYASRRTGLKTEWLKPPQISKDAKKMWPHRHCAAPFSTVVTYFLFTSNLVLISFFVQLGLPFGAFSFYLTPSRCPSLCLCLSPPAPLFSSSDAPPPLSHVYCSRKSSTDTSMCVCACRCTMDLQANLTCSWAKKWSKKKKKLVHVCQTFWSKHWLLKVTSQPCKHTPLNH